MMHDRIAALRAEAAKTPPLPQQMTAHGWQVQLCGDGQHVDQANVGCFIIFEGGQLADKLLSRPVPRDVLLQMLSARYGPATIEQWRVALAVFDDCLANNSLPREKSGEVLSPTPDVLLIKSVPGIIRGFTPNQMLSMLFNRGAGFHLGFMRPAALGGTMPNPAEQVSLIMAQLRKRHGQLKEILREGENWRVWTSKKGVVGLYQQTADACNETAVQEAALKLVGQPQEGEVQLCVICDNADELQNNQRLKAIMSRLQVDLITGADTQELIDKIA